jgi:hypothetical protein
MFQIIGAATVKETDDVVAAQICGVRHRRPPVAVGTNQDRLVKQRRLTRHERANRVKVIAPDRVRKLHGVREPRPARGLVRPRQYELRVSQLRGGGIDRFGVVRAEFSNSVRIPCVNSAKEFLGLTMELVEIGPDGQTANRHTSLLQRARGPLAPG